MSRIALLDPPTDGQFGPVSHWALGRFFRRVDAANAVKLDSGIARMLRDENPGQYKAWSVGTHKAGKATAHEALV